jgi:hypothetical protein
LERSRNRGSSTPARQPEPPTLRVLQDGVERRLDTIDSLDLLEDATT